MGSKVVQMKFQSSKEQKEKNGEQGEGREVKGSRDVGGMGKKVEEERRGDKESKGKRS